MIRKPILCLDFDGVLHSYSSGWRGARNIPDAPTDGAMRFLWLASGVFTIAILSSRSHHFLGRYSMRRWLEDHFRDYWQADRTTADDILAEIQWPKHKPPAAVTIDDRALTFTGNWADFHPTTLLQFLPWNNRPTPISQYHGRGCILCSDMPDGEWCRACGYSTANASNTREVTKGASPGTTKLKPPELPLITPEIQHKDEGL